MTFVIGRGLTQMNTDAMHKELTEKIIKFSTEFITNWVMVFSKKFMRMQ